MSSRKCKDDTISFKGANNSAVECISLQYLFIYLFFLTCTDLDIVFPAVGAFQV